MEEKLGLKVKQLRKQKKLTLKKIAEETNLSISFLSQLENGKSSATLESLKKISETLGVNPSYFFNDGEEKIASIQGNLDMSMLKKGGFVYHDLTRNMADPLFTPILVVINAGETKGNPLSHKGQEFLYVLEGTLTVIINNEELQLKPNESIFFDSTQLHYWLNKTEKPVKFLCISAGAL
ncbi:helix-turn-helix domain-containing protein [Ornithinibacillus halotolerans]|uniref:DNA-binding protein n=1 Tax=Ornithinibacillus halotolerans TaxID=1274357 RepID=A0A916WAB0_9BACI|nr:XRE family transcriptional regulator [Ornithinibacillus halotolerans]GGA79817.1 DNA-binding protein [Ornithinibacillus halotolerans]